MVGGMQYVIIAHDFTDPEALPRRMAARQAHIDYSEAAKARGEQLYAVALLNEAGQMCGSVLVVDFPTRALLEQWLKIEPYVTGRVWESVDVKPCKVGPSFTATSV